MMINVYLLYDKLLLIWIHLRRTAPFYYPGSSLVSLSLYPILLASAGYNNRTAQIIRIIRMFYMISTNPAGVGINELVATFGVCERTVYRDFERMEYAGIPIMREGHRIKLVESDTAENLVKKVQKVTGDGELRIKTKPGKLYDVARTLIASLDSINSIEPRHLQKWMHIEAQRQKRQNNIS
ncbi:MAG: hypothetical protein M1428_04060 [Deltaproteobacteria bacterium]|nr:hypothetical protein [Deltaproteobacteria bacterium]